MITEAQAKKMGLEQATQWKPRGTELVTIRGPIDYLSWCCGEVARLTGRAEVVYNNRYEYSVFVEGRKKR
jgi:hypothetical protein